MLIPQKGHTDTIQVYSVTVMTHVKALQAGHSSQGTSEPITPGNQNHDIDSRHRYEGEIIVMKLSVYACVRLGKLMV